jgi:hypothetical protein
MMCHASATKPFQGDAVAEVFSLVLGAEGTPSPKDLEARLLAAAPDVYED